MRISNKAKVFMEYFLKPHSTQGRAQSSLLKNFVLKKKRIKCKIKKAVTSLQQPF